MIEVRGPNVFTGLLNMLERPQKNSEKMVSSSQERLRTDRRGWLSSDRGTFEGFDYFWWLQYLPKRIELLLDEQEDGVLESAVRGPAS